MRRKLIVAVALVAIAAGVTFGLLRRAAAPRGDFVALDASGEVARRFGNVSVTSTTYLLDRRGRIVTRYVEEPDWQDFRSRVERALAESA